jgi:hypothetical protein
MQPFQQRVVIEKIELDEKLNRLTEFFGTEIFSGLDFAEQNRLKRQHVYMDGYSKILGLRVTAFGINPEDLAITSDGAALIAEERRRQIEAEGWTPEHDDAHTDGELALVAALFATPVPLMTVSLTNDQDALRPRYRGLTIEASDPFPDHWDDKWDKREKVPRIRLLTMAGALIAAEIDRLQRSGIPDAVL